MDPVNAAQARRWTDVKQSFLGCDSYKTVVALVSSSQVEQHSPLLNYLPREIGMHGQP